MATHQIPILNSWSLPDSSGDVFFEPASVLTPTNDLYDHLVLVFNDSGNKDTIAGIFHVPQNYVDTANLVIVWTSTATTGDVDFDLDYTAIGGNDTESLDPSSHLRSPTGSDTAPGTTTYRMTLTIALTDTDFTAGDSVPFNFSRDGVTEGGGGIAAAVRVYGAHFEYNDA